jgi:hypothetical protein
LILVSSFIRKEFGRIIKTVSVTCDSEKERRLGGDVGEATDGGGGGESIEEKDTRHLFGNLNLLRLWKIIICAVRREETETLGRRSQKDLKAPENNDTDRI